MRHYKVVESALATTPSANSTTEPKQYLEHHSHFLNAYTPTYDTEYDPKRRASIAWYLPYLQLLL